MLLGGPAHWFWLFMLLSRSLLEEECHLLQKEISDLQVSAALSLPQVLCLAGITPVCLRTYVYVKVCESTPVSHVSEARGSSFRLAHWTAWGLLPPLSLRDWMCGYYLAKRGLLHGLCTHEGQTARLHGLAPEPYL